ncbi:MAG: hypothetical protein UD936_11520 [Acutalibacteraceae bacterium]|nr:hypothetical protein [Acutalibacteraceae bacterium]
MTILLPAGALLSACFGYTFKLISTSAFAVAIAFLSVCVVVSDTVCKDSVENKTDNLLLLLITPLALINAVFYLFEAPDIFVAVSVSASIICCCILTVRHSNPFALKITALILSALMVLPVGFFTFIALFFGNLESSTILKTIESPSGKYYAQVINSDQGTLGGDTFVNVYEKGGINLVLFKIEKKPQRVYTGGWNEALQIHWKNHSCLVINSVEYQIE